MKINIAPFILIAFAVFFCLPRLEGGPVPPIKFHFSIFVDTDHGRPIFFFGKNREKRFDKMDDLISEIDRLVKSDGEIDVVLFYLSNKVTIADMLYIKKETNKPELFNKATNGEKRVRFFMDEKKIPVFSGKLVDSEPIEIIIPED